MHESQKLINHVALVLDASYSMSGRESKLVQVADEQIKHLALKSEELKQETRVSIYYFGDSTIECLLFDMDVMRLPSIGDLYKVLYENTALIDATLKSQQDLETTSQLYGDHAFLTFVLTDGEENRSRNPASVLSNLLRNMGENWSMGFLVPDRNGQRYLERLGVLADSIALWDTTSSIGLASVGTAIRSATDSFMTNRAKGIRGTRSVFSTGLDAVNKTTVTRSLSKMKKQDYSLFPVASKTRIDDFVRAQGLSYYQGIGFYQLTKTEDIQPQKEIVVVDKATKAAYSGPEARHLIGLPDGQKMRVRPNHNPQYDVYVQSTSLNRNLMPGTSLLVKR